MLTRVEITQFMDAIGERLHETEFEDYSSEDELVLDVADIVSQLVAAGFGDFGSVWVSSRDTAKVSRVLAYGADFAPSIVIGVGGFPTVAVVVMLAGRNDDVAETVTAAIGEAIIHSVQYPYVIGFVLDRSKSELGKHLFDSEIEDRLWDNHRISLVVRS